ncbi:hypothetical protein J3459_015905 [Metarhizium acridum]|nr:hypothetical protein J3459_015905 [Metarhizium acridum]
MLRFEVFGMREMGTFFLQGDGWMGGLASTHRQSLLFTSRWAIRCRDAYVFSPFGLNSLCGLTPSLPERTKLEMDAVDEGLVFAVGSPLFPTWWTGALRRLQFLTAESYHVFGAVSFACNISSKRHGLWAAVMTAAWSDASFVCWPWSSPTPTR